MAQTAIRFLVGGSLVAVFAVLADAFKPKSFAGLFAAAPSVALASLILAIRVHGPQYATTEARSMAVGGLAFVAYASSVGWILHEDRDRPWLVALACMLVWLVIVGVGGVAWIVTK